MLYCYTEIRVLTQLTNTRDSKFLTATDETSTLSNVDAKSCCMSSFVTFAVERFRTIPTRGAKIIALFIFSTEYP